MAYSYTAFTGNGSTTQYAVAFPYIRREHVAVTVAGVPATFTWVNSSLIQMDAAPAAAAAVRVYRTTPIDAPLVDFADGATLVAADLDTNSRQSIYIQQELDDAQTDNLPNVIPNGNKGDITTSVGGTVWAINTGAVLEAKIATGAVTETKLGTGAVTSAKILDGTILNADVNASAGITAGKLSFTQAGTGAVARTVDSRLKDVVSVKDFGAVGNGVADDTAAVQAAFTAAFALGVAVYFPAGTYKIISTVDAKTCSFYGESRNTSVVQCAVANGTRTFSNCGSSIRQMQFAGPGGGATPDGIAIQGYKYYVTDCYFYQLGAAICTTNIIVTTVISRCEFLTCVSAVNDKLHDGTSAHTTLYFTDNNVLYGSYGFYMKTEAQGFLIEGNVFEDMIATYHGSGAQIYQFNFTNNWIEQVYNNHTIFSSCYVGSSFTAVNNHLRPGSRTISDSNKLLAGQFSLSGDANGGGGGVRIQEDAIRLCSFGGGQGVRFTTTGIYPSAATANFTSPSAYYIETQSANSNTTAVGGDLIFSMGIGSNTSRAGLAWGLPKDGSSFQLLGRCNLSSNGVRYGLTLGSTSYYWGSTDDLAFLNSSIKIGASFSTGGNGLTTGFTDIYSGGKYNGGTLTSSPVLTCRFGDLSVAPGVDNQVSSGASGARWSVVYAGTATINTSDANEKQQIEELSEAERSVAKVIKGLIRKFKFNDAVAAKGDDARIHVGVVAQDVEQAFLDADLDPSNYGLFCRDEWWELDGQKAETNENGVVTITTYELNGESVSPDTDGNLPEGTVEITEAQQAIKKEILGIRYEELLAFVISTL